MDGMNQTPNIPQNLRLDERNHVEEPLLDQLDGLKWEIIDLDSKQYPGDNCHQRVIGNSLTRRGNVIFYVTQIGRRDYE